MRVNIAKVSSGHKLCFVEVNRQEALALIQSLSTQMVNNNPNLNRLESYCKGDCGEFSIAVIPEETT